MSPEDKSKIEFALSRFKSGQINAGQVVREIENMYGNTELELAQAKRRIAELEDDLKIKRPY